MSSGRWQQVSADDYAKLSVPSCLINSERKRNGKDWSGRWDSNPRLDLGKVPYYPYTTTALNRKTLARHRFGDKMLSEHV